MYKFAEIFVLCRAKSNIEEMLTEKNTKSKAKKGSKMRNKRLNKHGFGLFLFQSFKIL